MIDPKLAGLIRLSQGKKLSPAITRELAVDNLITIDPTGRITITPAGMAYITRHVS